MNITQVVRGTQANFKEYRDGNLWYTIEYKTSSLGVDTKKLAFPVPIEDTKGAVFPANIKSITLMRWIRKHITLINSGEAIET